MYYVIYYPSIAAAAGRTVGCWLGRLCSSRVFGDHRRCCALVLLCRRLRCAAARGCCCAVTLRVPSCRAICSRRRLGTCRRQKQRLDAQEQLNSSGFIVCS